MRNMLKFVKKGTTHWLNWMIMRHRVAQFIARKEALFLENLFWNWDFVAKLLAADAFLMIMQEGSWKTHVFSFLIAI